MLCPPPVRRGDPVRVIAPSGPFDRTLFFRALAWLAERYRVRWSREALQRLGYLAGSDRRRLDELNAALTDPDARAIIAARGGYGAGRICHDADFGALLRNPKWCVGFSDVTTIHLEAARIGVCSLHASNLTALGRSDHRGRKSFIEALEDPLACRSFEDLTVLIPGRAEGTLAGGNLSLISTAATSGRLALPARCLLVLEEVNEAPYRIDRMLTALLLGGHLRTVVGICVGDMGGDQDLSKTSALHEVLRERCGRLGVPMAAGLPVGHGRDNEPLPLGLPALLESHTAKLTVNPGGPGRTRGA